MVALAKSVGGQGSFLPTINGNGIRSKNLSPQGFYTLVPTPHKILPMPLNHTERIQNQYCFVEHLPPINEQLSAFFQ